MVMRKILNTRPGIQTWDIQQEAEPVSTLYSSIVLTNQVGN